MYFEHLAKLINGSNRNTYNLKIAPKKMSPMEFAKRNAHKPVEKRKGNKKIPYIHVQDIEDYYDDYHRNKFYGMINDMRTAENKFGIIYELGYSNYTFELWMLLHVAEMSHAVQDRKAYLGPINKYFHRKYTNIDEFKKEKEFQNILNESVSLESVRKAINRANRIVANNAKDGKIKESYRGFSFYRDNPDLSIHEIVQMIFDVCEIKR